MSRNIRTAFILLLYPSAPYNLRHSGKNKFSNHTKPNRTKTRERGRERARQALIIAAGQNEKPSKKKKKKSARVKLTVLSKEALSRRISRSSTILSTFTKKVSPLLPFALLSLFEYTTPGIFPSAFSCRNPIEFVHKRSEGQQRSAQEGQGREVGGVIVIVRVRGRHFQRRHHRIIFFPE